MMTKSNLAFHAASVEQMLFRVRFTNRYVWSSAATAVEINEQQLFRSYFVQPLKKTRAVTQLKPSVEPRFSVVESPQVVSATPSVNTPTAESHLFQRLKQGLQRTRQGLTEGIVHLFQGKLVLDADLLEQIESQLLSADVGVSASQKILQHLQSRMNPAWLKDPHQVRLCLEQVLFEIIHVPITSPLERNELPVHPYVLLVVGVNGVGKTTTIGKLAKRFQQRGHSVMLAAGDTFRAAAVEQLKIWGQRNEVPVIAQATGADSASVIFDAFQAAKARGIDILIADTAGRLHNKSHLIEELKKVKRVLQKLDADAPHEVMLVVDASTGQNAVNQVREFHQSMHLNSIVLTKMDGTAKGGVAFALCEQFGIPVSYIGVGEQVDDLRPFQARAFVQALCSHD